MVGVCTDDVKRGAVDLGFNVVMNVIMVMTGSYFGSKVTPKEPTKGAIIGGAVGLFANLLTAQKFALERIADHTRP